MAQIVPQERILCDDVPRTETYRFQQPPNLEGCRQVEFRLIYEGPLPAESNHPRTKEKHRIRKALHPQLREVWRQHDFLWKNVEYWAGQYQRCGYRFVPLVSRKQAVYCALDILFLRRDSPGNIVKSGGDIDNRIKVLFDGLRIIESSSQLAGVQPGADEDPFFCLLEDDALITEINITTDRLFTPAPPGDINDVVLVIHVKTGHIDFGELIPGKPAWWHQLTERRTIE